MKSKNKGQIFSLDFLLSTVMVFFAIALILQAVEIQAYYSKDDTQAIELSRIGSNASNSLVSNPQILCKVQETGDYLLNCINGTKQISKAGLGIPSEYKYNIKCDSGCTLNAPDASSLESPPNQYSSKRTVWLTSSDLSKSTLYKCINNTDDCSSLGQKITITVWKA